jgi:hypothetical protein
MKMLKNILLQLGVKLIETQNNKGTLNNKVSPVTVHVFGVPLTYTNFAVTEEWTLKNNLESIKLQLRSNMENFIDEIENYIQEEKTNGRADVKPNSV